eukprot:scaffold3299_cov116-Isochrysis_galbana.AAC.17
MPGELLVAHLAAVSRSRPAALLQALARSSLSAIQTDRAALDFERASTARRACPRAGRQAASSTKSYISRVAPPPTLGPHIHSGA